MPPTSESITTCFYFPFGHESTAGRKYKVCVLKMPPSLFFMLYFECKGPSLVPQRLKQETKHKACKSHSSRSFFPLQDAQAAMVVAFQPSDQHVAAFMACLPAAAAAAEFKTFSGLTLTYLTGQWCPAASGGTSVQPWSAWPPFC